jgi:hypothetical protein
MFPRMFWHAINNYSLTLLFVLNETCVSGLWNTHWSFPTFCFRKGWDPLIKRGSVQRNTLLNSNPCHIYNYSEIPIECLPGEQAFCTSNQENLKGGIYKNETEKDSFDYNNTCKM